MKTEMNDKLYLDDDEVKSESAALQQPSANADVTCWVGAKERPEFLRQNRLLAEIWASCGVETEWHEEPEKHHFDVIDDLVDPNSKLAKHFAP